MTRLSWTLRPSMFPGHILDQTANPCAVKIALNPPNKNHLSGEGAQPRFCCWSQPGQGKYLDNINSCGESKTPAYFSSLLLIILLIIQCALKAQPSAVGQRQSFYCWLHKWWCSAELPHTAARGWLGAGSARWGLAGHTGRGCPIAEFCGAAVLEDAADGLRSPAHPHGHGWALQSCCSPRLAGDRCLFPGVGTGKGPRVWGMVGGFADSEGSVVSIPVPAPLGLVGDEEGTVSRGTMEHIPCR